MRRLFCIISAVLISFISTTAQTINASGPISFCQGGSVILSVSGATGNPTFQWTLNGANISGATNNSLAVSASGTYNVSLTQGSTTLPLNDVIVTVYPKPIPSFTFTPDNACAKTPVQFTNSSTGSGLTYTWDFGDPGSGINNTSTDINPVHLFAGTPGTGIQTFNVKLEVTSVSGCKDSKTLTITINKRPDAKLGGTDAEDYNGADYFVACTSDPSYTFTFDNLSTTTAINTNYTIVWGDNTPNFTQSNFATVNHTYSTGFYTLFFIVAGSNNCIDTSVYSVFIGTNPKGSISSPGSTLGCTGTSFSFPFSNIQNNPQGTTYTITVNDGSPTVYYTQANVPAQFTHIFTKTSCGVSPDNAFTISYIISNPCGRTPGSIGGILISEKAQANFIISPKDTVCTNTPVTLTNTGTTGLTVPTSGSGSCRPGKSLWSILPGTGWSLSSGSLGDDKNQPLNANNWISGSTTVGLTFNNPGTYVIKLKNGNGSCGIDSIVKTICVNPIPVAAFDVNNITGCDPLTVTTTNNSSTPTCGQNIYDWTVSYISTAGCFPNISGYTYINGTSATSPNPQFQFTNPGVYTIGLKVIGPAGSCSSSVVIKQITVKGKPVANMNLASSVCLGQPVTPTATSSCNPPGTTYEWSFPGGNPSSSNTLAPGSITYSTAGTYIVTLKVTSECGPTTVQKQITVNAAPMAPTAGNNGPLCSGKTLNLTASTSTSGVTYSWTGPGGYTSTQQNPSLPNATTAMSGIYTITMISSNGCTSTATTNVLINQTPSNPGVTSPIINYCENATAYPLSATSTGGNTLNWYTVSTGGTASTIAPTPSTGTTGSTTYYVSQLNTTSPPCESARFPIVVNVFAVPNINGSYIDPTTCSSSDGKITITGLTPDTDYSIQYVKNGNPTTVPIKSSASGVIIISNLSGGTYTNITASLNGCISNAVGPFTLINPSAPVAPTAGNNGPLCSGGTLNLTATSSSVGATYLWTGLGFTSTSQNPVIPNATPAMSGNYSVTVKLNGCTSAPATTNVVVTQIPTSPIVSPVDYCQNAPAIPLTATPDPGNLLKWYTTLSGGVGATAPTPSTSTIGVTNYYVSQVTAAAPGCESERALIVVTVNAVPAITGNFSSPTNCLLLDGSITLSGLSSITNYTVKYIRDGGSQTTIPLTSNAGGNIIINNLAAGVYSNITVTLKGCTSNPVGPFTLVNPTAPAAPIAGSNGPLCSGGALNLTASLTVPGVTYLWTGPGFTSASQNPVRNNATPAMSGDYSVIVTLNGCTSVPATTNVVVTQTPTNPIVSPVDYCQNAPAIPLTATPDPGNLLKWYTTLSGGVGTTAPTPSTSTIGVTNYYVSQVTAAAPGCESERALIVVTVNAVPAITGNFSSPTNCLLLDGSITLSGLSPNTYIVKYIKDGGSQTTIPLTSNAGGNIIINNLAAGVYSNITVTLKGCTSNQVGPFTLVNPTAPAAPIAGSNGPLCSGGALNLTASLTVPGVTYLWTGPGFTSTSQNPVIPNTIPAMSGDYSVIVTLNGCTSAPATTNVVVTQTPTNPIVNGPVDYCQDEVAIPLTAQYDPGNLLKWYTTLSGGVGTTAPTPSTSTIGVTNYYVSQVTAAAPGCESERALIVVTVNAVPAITGNFSSPTNCLLLDGSITLSGLSSNTYIVKYIKDGGSQTTTTLTSNAGGNIIINNLAAGVYSNITVTLKGCASNPVGPLTLVNPTAPAAPIVGSNGPLCSGKDLNLTASSTVPGVTYLWTGPGSFINTSQNPVRNNATPAMSGDYSVIVTLNGCKSVPATTNVVVNQTPSNPLATASINYCHNAVATPLTANGIPGNILHWYTAAAGGISSTTAPVPNTAVIGSTTYYVSQYNSLTTCESGRTPILVTINPIPVIGANSSPPTTCNSNNGTITLTGLSANNSYNVKYTVNGVNITAPYTANANGNVIMNNLAAGTYSNLSASFNGCSSNILGPFVLVNPSVPATPTAGSNSPLCIGRTLMLTANSTTPGVSYSWTGPGGFASSSQNPNILNIQATASGRYYVSTRSNTCISEKDSVDIVINIDPIVNLGPDLLLPPGTQHVLTSTIQNGPIIQYTWTPSTNLSCTTCPRPTATIQSNISYSVQVTNSNGCKGKDTINIQAICEKAQIYIPNAFSPDGDGINDLLMVRSAGFVTVKYFRIFNKWGELVFERNNFSCNDASNGWNGKIKGVYSPPDVFVYTIEVMCENGTPFFFKGNVSILK